MSDACAGVCVIVLMYHPDPLALKALIAAVVPQVGRLVVVANDDSPIAPSSGVSIARQPRDIGLAAGFNVGIAYAREHGFDHVLLLDQDSEPAPDMVRTLASVLDAGARARIGAVGPTFHDAREARAAPFVRFRFPMSRTIRAAPSLHDAQSHEPRTPRLGGPGHPAGAGKISFVQRAHRAAATQYSLHAGGSARWRSRPCRTAARVSAPFVQDRAGLALYDRCHLYPRITTAWLS